MLITAHAINGDCFEISNRLRIVVDIGPDATPSFAHIVLLTHDDQDHISGAVNYLKRQSHADLIPKQELWVPYEWGVMARALIELHRSKRQGEKVAIPEGVAWRSESVDGERPGNENDGLWLIEGELWPPSGDRQDVTVEHEDAAPRPEKDHLAAVLANLDIPEACKALPRPRSTKTVGGRMLDSARRTAKTLQAAYSLGWVVRYFDHCGGCDKEHWRWVGKPGTLTLISAVEKRLSPPRGKADSGSVWNLLHASQLTIWNKRSLVSFAWDEHQCWFMEGEGGAVLWADARGPEGHSLPDFRISTAPHHGSNNPEHQDAWAAISNARVSATISSYNSSVSGPSGSFKKIPSAERACVRCWNGTAGASVPQSVACTSQRCGLCFPSPNGPCSSRGC